MGGAVIFVMVVSSICAFGINQLLLAIGAPYLRLISFIAVIASPARVVARFSHKIGRAAGRE